MTSLIGKPGLIYHGGVQGKKVMMAFGDWKSDCRSSMEGCSGGRRGGSWKALPVREGSSAVDLSLEHGFVGRLKRAFHGRITPSVTEGGGVNQEYRA